MDVESILVLVALLNFFAVSLWFILRVTSSSLLVKLNLSTYMAVVTTLWLLSQYILTSPVLDRYPAGAVLFFTLALKTYTWLVIAQAVVSGAYERYIRNKVEAAGRDLEPESLPEITFYEEPEYQSSKHLHY